jgi:hypothetical protein
MFGSSRIPIPDNILCDDIGSKKQDKLIRAAQSLRSPVGVGTEETSEDIKRQSLEAKGILILHSVLQRRQQRHCPGFQGSGNTDRDTSMRRWTITVLKYLGFSGLGRSLSSLLAVDVQYQCVLDHGMAWVPQLRSGILLDGTYDEENGRTTAWFYAGRSGIP